MSPSSLPAIRRTIASLPQYPRAFGPRVYPIAPGKTSRLRPTGDYPAAAGTSLNSRPAAAFLSIRADLNGRTMKILGRSGRPGPSAAWPRARSKPRLRVAPVRGAGL